MAETLNEQKLHDNATEKREKKCYYTWSARRS